MGRIGNAHQAMFPMPEYATDGENTKKKEGNEATIERYSGFPREQHEEIDERDAEGEREE